MGPFCFCFGFCTRSCSFGTRFLRAKHESSFTHLSKFIRLALLACRYLILYTWPAQVKESKLMRTLDIIVPKRRSSRSLRRDLWASKYLQAESRYSPSLLFSVVEWLNSFTKRWIVCHLLSNITCDYSYLKRRTTTLLILIIIPSLVLEVVIHLSFNVSPIF